LERRNTYQGRRYIEEGIKALPSARGCGSR
jgi:hypothetical protein